MKKFSAIWLVLVLVALPLWRVSAQQDPHFSHFMFMPQYANPGSSGIEGVSRATFIHRMQWLGYSGIDEGGAPVTSYLSFSHPLRMFGSPTANSGVGMFLYRDQLGAQRNYNLKLSYSYHIDLRTGGTLGIGVRGGFYSRSIDGSILRPAEEGDGTVDAFGAGWQGQFRPDLGLGLWYQSTKYYVGVGVGHVVESTFSFDSDSVNNQLVRTMNISGGYTIQLSGSVSLVPSASIYTDFRETSFNYGLLGVLNDYKYWGGLTLRQSFSENNKEGKSGVQLSNDDVVILAGMSLLQDKSLRVGYSFDIVSSGVSAKNPTSHELFLSYVLPIGLPQGNPPLRTPRYRHEN